MSGQYDRRPAREPEQKNQRLLVTVLLVGGLALVLLTQQSLAPLMGLRRALAFGLIGVGLASFALAASLIAQARIPAGPAAVLGRSSAYLGVSNGQLIMLFYGPCFGLLAGLAAGESLRALNVPVSLLAYLLALGAMVAGSYRPDKQQANQFDRWDLLIVCTLFALALFLRLVNLEHLPPTLSGDEGSTGLQAVAFIDGKADNLFTVGWFSFPSLFFAFQGIGIRLFGQTVAGLRFMSVLAGALTVVGVYCLARTIFDRLLATLAALLLATMHYHIHFSRLGLNNIWDGLFAVFVLAGIAYGWRYGRRAAFLMAGLLLGLGQYFYVSFRAMPLLLLLWAALAFAVDRHRLRRLLPDLILLAAVAFVVALPLHVYFAAHPDEFYAPMSRVTVFDGWLDQMSRIEDQSQLSILVQQIARTAAGITHLPLRHWYNPGAPLLLAGSAGLFLLGLLWLLLHPRLLHWLILLPILAVVILGGLSLDAPASQRYVLAVPLIAIVVAIPLGVAARWLWLAWPRFRPLVGVALVLVLSWLAWRNVHYYFAEVFEDYVLGGRNTETATAIARYLDDRQPPPTVYFFGLPRMGYRSLSTIPYLVPQVTGQDVADPLQVEPEWRLSTPTVFLFLPEREKELDFVRARYPDGTLHWLRDADGLPLFLTYEVSDP